LYGRIIVNPTKLKLGTITVGPQLHKPILIIMLINLSI